MIRKLLLAGALALSGIGGAVGIAALSATPASAVSGLTCAQGLQGPNNPAKTIFGILSGTSCDGAGAGNSGSIVWSVCTQVLTPAYGWINDSYAGTGTGQACNNAGDSTDLYGDGTCVTGYINGVFYNTWFYRNATYITVPAGGGIPEHSQYDYSNIVYIAC